MKHIHLRRHAEKGTDGLLTERGEEQARELGVKLAKFMLVISSPSPRAIRTVELITGQKPEVDERANFYMATQEKSDAINELSSHRSLSFLEAAHEYADEEVLSGIDERAAELNKLIAEIFTRLGKEETALIVSHDLCISPAMAQRGIPLESIDPLEGYIITEAGDITPTWR